MSQKKRILEYMARHGKISSMDAFRDLQITRLSGRIKDLRDVGYPIVTTMVESRDIDGKLKSRYAEYSIKA